MLCSPWEQPKKRRGNLIYNPGREGEQGKFKLKYVWGWEVTQFPYFPYCLCRETPAMNGSLVRSGASQGTECSQILPPALGASTGQEQQGNGNGVCPWGTLPPSLGSQPRALPGLPPRQMCRESPFLASEDDDGKAWWERVENCSSSRNNPRGASQTKKGWEVILKGQQPCSLCLNESRNPLQKEENTFGTGREKKPAGNSWEGRCFKHSTAPVSPAHTHTHTHRALLIAIKNPSETQTLQFLPWEQAHSVPFTAQCLFCWHNYQFLTTICTSVPGRLWTRREALWAPHTLGEWRNSLQDWAVPAPSLHTELGNLCPGTPAWLRAQKWLFLAGKNG